MSDERPVTSDVLEVRALSPMRRMCFERLATAGESGLTHAELDQPRRHNFVPYLIFAELAEYVPDSKPARYRVTERTGRRGGVKTQ